MSAKVPEILRGYKPLKRGRIHLLCPQCGWKLSNMPRGDHDPPNSVLLVIPCDKNRCSGGCKIEGGDYFDEHGNEIDWHKWYRKLHPIN